LQTAAAAAAAAAAEGEAGSDVCSPEEDEATKAVVNSSKTGEVLKALCEIRDRTGGVEKTVIFSNFVKYLNLLQGAVSAAGFQCARIDGTMNHSQRSKELKRFTEDPSVTVIFCSMKSCGTGITLTAANNVFLVDLWWSPAVDLQAIDRVHRLGQTREVRVLRFLCENTIDEKIFALQKEKSDLAQMTFESNVKRAGELRRRNMERLLD
jgi:SNF2 family DNA or RNA helicase